MTAPLTHAEATRVLVANYDAEGDSAERIAERLGLTVSRVDRILDELDTPHDIPERAPAIEPLAEKVVHAPQSGSVSPIRPARTTQPGPAPTRSSPRPVKPAPEPVKPAERPAAEVMPSGRERVHGTRRGYQQHYRFKEKPCQECKDAWNSSQLEKRATARALEAAANGTMRPVPDGVERRAAAAAAPDLRPDRPDRDSGPGAPGVSVVPPMPAGGATRFQAGGVLPSRPPQPVRVRPTVQVRWLIPRGEQLPAGTHIEYAIRHASGMRIVSAATAEIEADSGLTVFRRLVTDWVEVTG